MDASLARIIFCGYGFVGNSSKRIEKVMKNLFLTFCAVLAFSAPAFAAKKVPEKAAEKKPMATYDLPYIGDMLEFTTQYEDTFVKIARDHDLGYVEVRAANPDIDPWLPGAGTKLILPAMHILPDAPHKGVVINLPEMRLFVYTESGQVTTVPIGIGREGLSTPVGETKIMRKVVGPIWHPTARMKKEDPTLPDSVPPGLENPMGTHALYLGWNEYAIHGTDKPYGIGRRVSSGCIRLYPEDIIRVYNLVPVDSLVRVVNQPVKAALIDGKMYVEAHTSVEQATRMENLGGLPLYEFTDDDMKMITKVAGDLADRLDWSEVRRVVRQRKGYPIAIPLIEEQKVAEAVPAPEEAKIEVTEKTENKPEEKNEEKN